ncbi:MAG: protein translocase subunit SecF [Proteobacteria bacterium]|nr:protein translocase subunit SecF [Pseudomonadota bacterium]
MRLKLVPSETFFDFFRLSKFTLGASALAMIVSIVLFFMMGLNYGIDFRGGTTIRTDAQNPVDMVAYRAALSALKLGDVTITQVINPAAQLTGEVSNVAQIRIEAQEGAEAATIKTIKAVKAALVAVDPTMSFPQIDSVGPKVSGELIQTAVIAVIMAISAVLFYIWLRFEWQFSVGAVAALVHDIVLTIGIFSLLQIKFDLAIIAALLTIVGYSLNDTVVVFDRVRENLRKYKQKPLKDLLNLSINETLSRTVMTSVTTLIALGSLFVLGGDVIHGFVFAMIWGVIIGTYSSVFVASAILLRLGVKRDWDKVDDGRSGTQFANIDA